MGKPESILFRQIIVIEAFLIIIILSSKSFGNFDIIGFFILSIIGFFFQVILYLIFKKVKISDKKLNIISFLPLFILVIILFSPKNNIEKENQKNHLWSADKKYELEMPINWSYKESANVWKPTIKDREGKVMYVDENSDMLGRFNIYWLWSKDDVWVYESDLGRIFVYILENGIWYKKSYEELPSAKQKEKPEELH